MTGGAARTSLTAEETTHAPTVVTAAIGVVAAAVAIDAILTPPAGSIVEMLSPALAWEQRSWSSLGIILFLGGILVAVGALLRCLRLLADPARRKIEGAVRFEDGRLIVGDRTLVARIVGSAAIERSKGVYEVHVFDGRRLPRAVLTGMEPAAVASIERDAKPSRKDGFFEPTAFSLGLSLHGGRRMPVVVMQSPFMIILVMLIALPFLRKRFAVVHADRLVVRRWRTEKAISLADIVRTTIAGNDLVLQLRNGTSEVVHGETSAQITALARHLVLARGAAGLGSTSRQLRRDGRSAEAWVDALARLDAPAYRQGALASEHLWAILFDTASERSARIAAALLVRRSTTDRDASRIATLARTFDDVGSRKALEAIAAADLLATNEAAHVLAAID